MLRMSPYLRGLQKLEFAKRPSAITMSISLEDNEATLNTPPPCTDIKTILNKIAGSGYWLCHGNTYKEKEFIASEAFAYYKENSDIVSLEDIAARMMWQSISYAYKEEKVILLPPNYKIDSHYINYSGIITTVGDSYLWKSLMDEILVKTCHLTVNHIKNDLDEIWAKKRHDIWYNKRLKYFYKATTKTSVVIN